MKIFVIIISWVLYFLWNREKIYLVNFGGVDNKVIRSVKTAIKSKFGANVIVISKSLADSVRVDKVKYNAIKIMAQLATIGKEHRIIGITDKPLYYLSFSRWNWQSVYGMGDIPGVSAIISTNRLDSASMAIEMEILALHELGHTYGLKHCSDTSCYMNEGDGYTSSFSKTTHFCKSCKIKLKNGKKMASVLLRFMPTNMF